MLKDFLSKLKFDNWQIAWIDELTLELKERWFSIDKIEWSSTFKKIIFQAYWILYTIEVYLKKYSELPNWFEQFEDYSSDESILILVKKKAWKR